MKIGDKILLCRKEAGLSQEQLAARLGVSRQAVSRWETGEAVPDTEKIILLRALFDVSTDYLLLEELEEKQQAIKVMNPQADALIERQRHFRMTLGKSLLWVGAISFLASLILSVLYSESIYMTEWTDLGKLGTALFQSYLTFPLCLGLILAITGIAILWREYKRMD